MLSTNCNVLRNLPQYSFYLTQYRSIRQDVVKPVVNLNAFIRLDSTFPFFTTFFPLTQCSPPSTRAKVEEQISKTSLTLDI